MLWNRFKPSSKIFLLTVPRRYFFCGLFMFFSVLWCMSVYLYLVVTYWERAGLLALVCGVSLQVCHFPSGVLLDCIDS